MKIIAHRGASGSAPENSRASLVAAVKHGVDMIEFDVRLTADDHLIVIHDRRTGRVTDTQRTVRELTLNELHALSLDNGESFLSLDEALDAVGGTPVIIELKDTGSVDELLLVLERHPAALPSIASFHRSELQRVKRVLPNIPTYALEHFAPIDIITSARQLHATGIGLNKWLTNPLTYRLARHYHLELYVYTVNSLWLARFLSKLYPAISLCTDVPEKLRA